MVGEGTGGLTSIELSPGQAPPTKEPPHLSDAFMQVPSPLEVLHEVLMQHWMLAAPGQ